LRDFLQTVHFGYKKTAFKLAPCCRLGGVVVSVLVTELKGCGFEAGQGDGLFKGDKNPQHTFLSYGK
jgi:hypothetical protein